MASTVLGSALPLLLLLGLVLLSVQHGHSFAQLRQESPAALRERSGQALRMRAGDRRIFNMNREDKRILRRISSAGEKREWSAVESAFASYTGDAVPIYTAALHAAVRCREYKEGARIFEQCQQKCKVIDAPVYVQALRIFGKLNEFAKVDDVWAEALDVCEFSAILASARLAAAADQGDIEGAAALLDKVNASGIPVDTGLVTSAIRACWGPGKYRDKAARYFYGLFGKLGLVPTVVTFGTLAGALKTSSLEDVLWTYAEMKALQIAPNRVFAETFLTAVLGQDDKSLREVEQITNSLRNKPKERLEAARDVLIEFESSNVELSLLCRKFKTALKKLGF